VSRLKLATVIAATILSVSLLGAAGAATATASSTTRYSGACGSSPAHSLRSPRKEQRLRRRCRAAQRAARATARRRQRAASLARASIIASVLATPCQNAQLMPEPANLELVGNAVFCLVNRVRAENGETPLIRNSRLDAAAEGHGAEMISADYFEHVSPTGETPVDRIRETGYIPGPQDGYVIGENLAWGTLSLATPQAIVEAWVASPKHFANIREGQYRETGIGVVPTVPAALSGGEPGATYSQEFGVILR
jgi:uncharacterized protein YkwD